MANHTGDDLFDQILGFPPYAGAVPNLAGNQWSSPMMSSMNAPGSVKSFSNDVVAAADTRLSFSIKSGFQAQSMHNPHPPASGQRKRAKRGQATDPHSIAEREDVLIFYYELHSNQRLTFPTAVATNKLQELRRERIAERIRALQELVPCVNKTNRATMLDEIVDYVKFLRLQVKVLSMSRLGGAGAVAPLMTDIPISSIEEEGGEDQGNQPPWEKWSNDGTERQVAKLMEENVGAAMQLLQSNALCIMPISLASAIYHTQPPDCTTLVHPESDHHS